MARSSGKQDARFLDSFRTSTLLLKNSDPSKYDRVSFGYLDENSQRDFVGSLVDVVDDNKNNHSDDFRKVGTGEMRTTWINAKSTCSTWHGTVLVLGDKSWSINGIWLE